MPAGKASLVLAIDIGTSSVRTALFDRNARRIEGTLTQRPHAVTYSTEGAAELDVRRLQAGLEGCLRGTLRHAVDRKISDVGVSCFWHSLVGTDSRGDALTPVYTWADARCREDAARLRAESSEAAYHARTGCMLRASYWPAKLRWLARTQKSLWRKVARWQSPAEFLLGQLCERGGDICAHGMATGTGLYNPQTLRWDARFLKEFGLGPDQIPVIEDAPVYLRQEFRHWKPLADARWWPAIGDGAAGNLGSGATRPGRAAINVGTSAAFRFMRDGAVGKIPFGLFCYRVDAARFVVGGAVSNAGNLRAWCRRELNLPKGEAALDRALAARPGPSGDLTVLPFWSAERAPTWCEELRGTITGLSQHTTALDLLQATTEGVYQRLALIADLSLDNHRKKSAATEIIVSGGILKSVWSLQRLADVLGRPLHSCTEPEASLRGAAVYALERGGGKPSETGLVGRAVQPQPASSALYARERRRQKRLEAVLTAAEISSSATFDRARV